MGETHSLGDGGLAPTLRISGGCGPDVGVGRLADGDPRLCGDDPVGKVGVAPGGQLTRAARFR